MQERLVCTPLTKKTDHGEQNDPFCSPERVEDSYSEHKGPFRTSKGLHAFPYERALPLLVSFCPRRDRKTFVIPLFLSPPEQKDFRNQLINNSLLNKLLALWSDADGKGTILERIGEKGTWVGLCRERWPEKRSPGGVAPGASAPGASVPGVLVPGVLVPGPDEAMTAFCSTNIPGPTGPDKEEFAVKRPVPLPFSPAERNGLFLLRRSTAYWCIRQDQTNAVISIRASVSPLKPGRKAVEAFATGIDGAFDECEPEEIATEGCQSKGKRAHTDYGRRRQRKVCTAKDVTDYQILTRSAPPLFGRTTLHKRLIY